MLKDWATSFVTFIFLVVGITGIMMFFHILDNYTKQMHEILGLAFVLAAILHVVVNFKAMKNYFTNRRFLMSAIFTGLITIGFVLTAPQGKSPKSLVFNAMMTNELEQVSSFLHFDLAKAKSRLKKEGIIIKNLNSLNAIAKHNKTSAFRILDIMVMNNNQ